MLRENQGFDGPCGAPGNRYTDVIIHQGEWSGWEGTPWDVKHVSVGTHTLMPFRLKCGSGCFLFSHAGALRWKRQTRGVDPLTRSVESRLNSLSARSASIAAQWPLVARARRTVAFGGDGAHRACDRCEAATISWDAGYDVFILSNGLPRLPCDSGHGPHCRDRAQPRRHRAMFELLLADFLDLQELGVDRTMLRDPVRRQLLKETVMPAASRLSSSRAGALVAALRRWRTYALENQFEVRTPSPLQMSAFFRAVASGGPTAAASMFHALKWYRQHFALHFELDHWLLKPYKLLPLDHTVQKKQELQPWEMVNLLLRLRQAQGTHLLLLAMFTWAATSCIRFEHFQCSHFVGEADTFLLSRQNQAAGGAPPL